MRAFILFLLCVFTFGAFADETWTLTTADFRRQTVTLQSLDGQGARVILFGQNQPATIPLDKILQFDRGSSTQQMRGAYTLYLVSGDRVGGEPLGIANDNITWKSPAAGNLTIALKDVRGIIKGQETPAFDSARTEDAAFLTNGDNVKGIITGLDGGKLSIKQASGDAVSVDFSDVRAVHFAATKGDNPVGRAFRVQLSDGSVVTAPQVKLNGDKVMLSLGGDTAPRAVDLNQVVLIEQLNGPVSWLSARVPSEVIYQPMFESNASYSPKMDRDYKGAGKIKFAGKEYNRGIGVHAYTKISYALDGTFKVFRTQYAMTDDAAKGRVTVRILLDGKVVHEARDFPPGKLSPIIQIDLGSAKTLALEVHPGGDASSADRALWHPDTQARLNWIEPALLKEKPEPPPAPKPPVPTPTKSDPPADPQTPPKPKDQTPAPDPKANPDPAPKSDGQPPKTDRGDGASAPKPAGV